VASLAGVALRCRGLLNDDPVVLVRAVDAFRAGPRPLELALACEDAARALGAAGRVGEARPLFDDALGLYERLEAAWDMARAAARLRGLGIRRGRRGPRQRSKSGWDSLTTTERKVVQLVAEGLSNPEIAERMFISRGTVHTHVSHILAKQGLRSRVELAAETSRLGIQILPFDQVREQAQQLQPAREGSQRPTLDPDPTRPATGCWSSTQIVITMAAG
jgi:DNA-binding CsgD family transcriptional regulator